MAKKYADMPAAEVTKDISRCLTFFQDKMAFTISPMTLKEMIDDPEIQIVDVRKAEDYDKSHIPNAISLPLKDLEAGRNKLSKDKINVLYCYNPYCHLAATVAIKLLQAGYPVTEMDGGYWAWEHFYKFEVVS